MLKRFNVEMLVRCEILFATGEEHISPEGLGETSLKIHAATGPGNVRYRELSPSNLRKNREINVVIVKPLLSKTAVILSDCTT